MMKIRALPIIIGFVLAGHHQSVDLAIAGVASPFTRFLVRFAEPATELTERTRSNLLEELDLIVEGQLETHGEDASFGTFICNSLAQGIEDVTDGITELENFDPADGRPVSDLIAEIDATFSGLEDYHRRSLSFEEFDLEESPSEFDRLMRTSSSETDEAEMVFAIDENLQEDHFTWPEVAARILQSMETFRNRILQHDLISFFDNKTYARLEELLPRIPPRRVRELNDALIRINKTLISEHSQALNRWKKSVHEVALELKRATTYQDVVVVSEIDLATRMLIEQSSDWAKNLFAHEIRHIDDYRGDITQIFDDFDSALEGLLKKVKSKTIHSSEPHTLEERIKHAQKRASTLRELIAELSDEIVRERNRRILLKTKQIVDSLQ